ncbi:MAG: CapA family protein [Patescibacteria group bacterium]|nr:CapA family protein [Patescibacteria group bacterium]
MGRVNTIIWSILAITFGAGVVWMGTSGFKEAALALANIPRRINLTAQSSNTFPSSVSNSPSQPKVTVNDPSEVRILIGGDMMFDRYVRVLGNDHGYDWLFNDISPLMKSADIAIANLEGPIVATSSKTVLPSGRITTVLSFAFEPAVVGAMADAGFTAVSLANNHTFNRGQAGLDETRSWLSDAGIGWFGDPLNKPGTYRIIMAKGVPIAFVGYHEFYPGLNDIISDIEKLHGQGYPVIVMAHWGDEYATSSDALQHKIAKQMADAGATAIIGAHPHVVENNEWIGDVPVVYSLGNLVFDQYFQPDVMHGEIAELDFSRMSDSPDGKPRAALSGVKLHPVSYAAYSGPKPDGDTIDLAAGKLN